MNCLIYFAAACLAASAWAEKVTFPDPLMTSRGTRVSNADQWHRERRPEILELFREHVYGRTFIGRPRDLTFKVATSDAMEGKALRRLVDIQYSGRGGTGVIHAVMFVPRATDKPSPCFLLICNRGHENIDPDRKVKSPFWPAEEIVRRGYATIAFQVGDVDPDVHDGFTNGVHGIFDPPGGRQADAWGTIAAWAWGSSRVMDYLATDPLIDSEKVAVIGHSRGGKTALWAGAEDERFALVISNDSGSTGAAVARGKQGERIQDINRHFPHWFNQNYKRYNDRENDLPVDQHMLAALIAPRLLYIASASLDSWADPKQEFLAGVLAEPVYALYQLKGLGTNTLPAPEQPLQQGAIGHHLRTGKHDLTEYDWARFMDFADRHLSSPGVKRRAP